MPAVKTLGHEHKVILKIIQDTSNEQGITIRETIDQFYGLSGKTPLQEQRQSIKSRVKTLENFGSISKTKINNVWHLHIVKGENNV